MFAGDGSHIDFSDRNAHLRAFGESDAVAKANAQFDDRVAAVLRAAAATEHDTWGFPNDQTTMWQKGLLNRKVQYGLSVWSLTSKCLAMLAYPDFFVRSGADARSVVSDAILASNPGWCGTFPPGVNSLVDVAFLGDETGDYDFRQMTLLPIVYRYYDELRSDAREYLINELLAGGVVHGPGQKDVNTCGPYPEYWSRAGVVKVPDPIGLTSVNLKRVGETENHILMIMTARYLTNQLLYQRDPTVLFDNRRNTSRGVVARVLENMLSKIGIKARLFRTPKEPSPGSCTFLLLDLLQRILRDDFSEYNAKPYQKETRWALLNLGAYAYDHEVRLAAKMVLDYVSAHFAVSSNDLRRLVPFRRRNEEPKNNHDEQGFMTAGILEWQDGADTMGPIFGVLAGNTRAYETRGWKLNEDGSNQVIDALSDYRLPPSIHDLFVNDSHRRFHQRLHRFIRGDEEEVGGNRNCDNMEIYAGSPSYLITAGGAPAPYAIDPFVLGIAFGDNAQQLGVAVTTTFMPTTYRHKAFKAKELIQFSSFSDDPVPLLSNAGARNYGVAPDFACGHQIDLPDWVKALRGTMQYVTDDDDDRLTFIDQGPLHGPLASVNLPGGRPGFFLAICQENGLAFLEALDTWLHPGVAFEDFKESVKVRTANLHLQNNVETHYRTWNGNEFDFIIWNGFPRKGVWAGAEVLNLKYDDREPRDAVGDAGKADRLLNGTVMNSTDDAVVEITNYDLGTKITLDMKDLLHPKRISESGEVEQAGFDNEVWLDFDWEGRNQGDAFQPFSTLAAATAAVADGGVIKIIPGLTRERTTIGGKRMKLVAPIGGVIIGIH